MNLKASQSEGGRVKTLARTCIIVILLCSSCYEYRYPEPEVIDVNNLDGSVGVVTDGVFRYTFSQPIYINTVTASTFFIVQTSSVTPCSSTKAPYDPEVCDVSSALGAMISCSMEGFLPACTLTPDEELAQASGYVVCLSPDIKTRDSAIGSTFSGEDFEGFMASFTTFGYSIGGTVQGLEGFDLVLQNNGGDDLTIESDGTFTFATVVPGCFEYDVSIVTQPVDPRQTCTVSNGAGTLCESNVTDVGVDCVTDSYSVGGTVTGLLETTLVLQNNGGDDLAITNNGGFTFSTKIDDGSTYDVTVGTQPPNQICTVANGSGTIDGSNITDVELTCVNIDPVIYTSLVTGASGGDLGGVAGADGFCMADDSYPGTGTYEALIVDGANRVACTTPNCGGGAAEHVDWVLAANTLYYRNDGVTQIGTTNNVGLFPFPLDNSVSADGGEVWTGLDTDWTSDLDCVNWSSSAGGDDGAVGAINRTDDNAIRRAIRPCNRTTIRLMCVEQ